MFHFSFSTVLMALLAGNILAILISLFLRHRNTMTRLGYQMLSLFVALTIARLLIPFEFLFSNNLILPHTLSKIVFSLRTPRIHVLNAHLSCWNLFEIIWVGGIVVNLVLYVHDYLLTKNYILRYGQNKTEEEAYQRILDELCRQHKKRNRFHVVVLPNLNIPILLGFKDPYIILPDHLASSSGDLYYILSHETLHFFHHDFLIKMAVRILSIFYWWNPACTLLYKQTDILLEMNIDQKITHNSPEITAQYMECLVHIRENSLLYSSRTPRFIKREGCFFLRSKESDFMRRITMLLHHIPLRKKAFTGIALSFVITGICLLSYFFILEADYCPPQLEQSLIFPTSNNTYFIKDEFSNYEVYINDIYAETISSLEYYPSGIKVYNKEGDFLYEN